MKRDIYSKGNLVGLANELLAYLYHTESYRAEELGTDERLSDDVLIYTCGNLYFVNAEEKSYEFDGAPIAVKEGIRVENQVERCNKKTLTMVMNSVLTGYLYHFDAPDSEEIWRNVREIFERHGFSTEFGDGRTMYAYTGEDRPQYPDYRLR